MYVNNKWILIITCSLARCFKLSERPRTRFLARGCEAPTKMREGNKQGFQMGHIIHPLPHPCPLISPMQLGMHIVRVVVIDANHTYAHTKGPSEGIENKTSASFKYVMTFSCQDKRGLVPTRPKPLSMILLVLDELKLCFQTTMG